VIWRGHDARISEIPLGATMVTALRESQSRVQGESMSPCRADCGNPRVTNDDLQGLVRGRYVTLQIDQTYHFLVVALNVPRNEMSLWVRKDIYAGSGRGQLSRRRN
jgi:hypothetical protein